MITFSEIQFGGFSLSCLIFAAMNSTSLKKVSNSFRVTVLLRMIQLINLSDQSADLIDIPANQGYQNMNSNRGRAGYYNRGNGNYQRAGYRGTGQAGKPQPTKEKLKFESDYDFEKANEQFQETLNNITVDLKKTKIDGNVQCHGSIKSAAQFL